MKKGTFFALAGLGAAAGVALHSYLDVMYKETIPAGPLKRMQQKDMGEDLSALSAMCDESMKWVDAQDIETITLKNGRDEMLKGFFLKSESDSKLFCLFAHGYRASHRGDSANFFRFYHELGYNYLAVDHTASGDSEGDWVGFDYYESEDMLRWVDYLIQRFGSDIKIVLHGVSMGGATVCKMADRIPPQVKAIVADCPYTAAKDEFIAVAKTAGITKGVELVYQGMNVLNKALAGYDLDDTDVRENVKNTKVPMLFIHGTADDFVPTAMGKELYELCTADKELFLVDGAKHAESIVVDTDGYHKRVTEFLNKYV